MAKMTVNDKKANAYIKAQLAYANKEKEYDKANNELTKLVNSKAAKKKINAKKKEVKKLKGELDALKTKANKARVEYQTAIAVVGTTAREAALRKNYTRKYGQADGIPMGYNCKMYYYAGGYEYYFYCVIQSMHYGWSVADKGSSQAKARNTLYPYRKERGTISVKLIFAQPYKQKNLSALYPVRLGDKTDEYMSWTTQHTLTQAQMETKKSVLSDVKNMFNSDQAHVNDEQNRYDALVKKRDKAKSALDKAELAVTSKLKKLKEVGKKEKSTFAGEVTTISGSKKSGLDMEVGTWKANIPSDASDKKKKEIKSKFNEALEEYTKAVNSRNEKYNEYTTLTRQAKSAAQDLKDAKKRANKSKAVRDKAVSEYNEAKAKFSNAAFYASGYTAKPNARADGYTYQHFMDFIREYHTNITSRGGSVPSMYIKCPAIHKEAVFCVLPESLPIAFSYDMVAPTVTLTMKSVSVTGAVTGSWTDDNIDKVIARQGDLVVNGEFIDSSALMAYENGKYQEAQKKSSTGSKSK